MHFVLSITNATYLIRLVTRFTTEIFGAMIAVIYIYTAVEDMVKFFTDLTLEAAFLSMLLAYVITYK